MATKYGLQKAQELLDKIEALKTQRNYLESADKLEAKCFVVSYLKREDGSYYGEQSHQVSPELLLGFSVFSDKEDIMRRLNSEIEKLEMKLKYFDTDQEGPAPEAF